MFAIAPASGPAHLTAPQRRFLTGKARWIRAMFEAGIPTVPSIVVSRAAWNSLQVERRQQADRLRAHWVATLFRLVGADSKPPLLTVRTASDTAVAGLMPARTGLPAPSSEAEAVDPKRPLGRAIADAFESYGEDDDAIVIVQAMANGEIVQFLSRDTLSGAMGPAPVPNNGGIPLAPDAVRMSEVIDRLAGRHMTITAELDQGVLTFLSARTYQASASAELEAATDRVERGTWTEQQAVASFSPDRLQAMLHPSLKGDHGVPLATGLGESPGAAPGGIVITAEDAARWKARGRHVILVVNETGPADIDGMKAATGILTARGGMTSHAGVIARITGKPCVAGVRTLSVDPVAMAARIGDTVLRGGDRITIAGSDGSVYLGALPLSQPHIGGALGELLGWSVSTRRIEVRSFVVRLDVAMSARSFGGVGIGLARSEHMFFSRERLVALRRLILSEEEDDRKAALK